jgi:hypothetical protein
LVGCMPWKQTSASQKRVDWMPGFLRVVASAHVKAVLGQANREHLTDDFLIARPHGAEMEPSSAHMGKERDKPHRFGNWRYKIPSLPTPSSHSPSSHSPPPILSAFHLPATTQRPMGELLPHLRCLDINLASSASKELLRSWHL